MAKKQKYLCEICRQNPAKVNRNGVDMCWHRYLGTLFKARYPKGVVDEIECIPWQKKEIK